MANPSSTKKKPKGATKKSGSAANPPKTTDSYQAVGYEKLLDNTEWMDKIIHEKRQSYNRSVNALITALEEMKRITEPLAETDPSKCTLCTT